MRRAMLLLLGSIALCSACARPAPVMVTAPLAECPAPSAPALPALDPSLPLDSPANVEALMIRDDALRGYIRGLESSMDCYRKQVR